MATKRHYFISILLLFCCVLAAQGQEEKERKIYPAPKLTPQVEKIRSTMTRFIASRSDVELPQYVDNSKSKYFPPIIDQDGGSCAQASSIGYLFSYEINRLLDRDASESKANRFAYKFSWNMLNGGQDEGGFAEEGLYLAQRYGMMTEADYGDPSVYQFKWATGYDKYYNALQYRVKEILTFSATDLASIKRYLYDAGDGSKTGGVIAFSTQSGNWKIDNSYSGPSATGYRSLLKKLSTTGAHAMTIAGYDDLVSYTDDNGTTHTGAFIVVNTWGTFSHDNGRFYLPYDFFLDETVAENQLSRTMRGARVMIYKPKWVFKIKLSYTSRNDLSFGTAFYGGEEENPVIQYSYAQAFNNQGGDYPMQGQYLSEDIEIAIDATDQVKSDATQMGTFYLAVKKSAIGKEVGTGQVQSISLIDYRGEKPVEYVCKSTSFPAEIKPGVTAFSVSPDEEITVSASPYKYLENENVTNKTFILKTADGKSVKLRFSNLNSAIETIDIRHNAQ